MAKSWLMIASEQNLTWESAQYVWRKKAKAITKIADIPKPYAIAMSASLEGDDFNRGLESLLEIAVRISIHCIQHLTDGHLPRQSTYT
jgi:hypothetical protein